MADFTTDIDAKVAVLTEYGVGRDAARRIAGTNHLGEIRYLARRVESDGNPADAAAQIVTFFETRDQANQFFYGMRPAHRAAAQYAVGVRNDEVLRYSPEMADMVAGPHSDLDTKQTGYKHEMNYRFVKLFDVRQRLAAGENVPVGERAAWDRFQQFMSRVRGA